MFSVVLGQCSEAMMAKLESEKDYEKISEDSNVIKLFKLIRNVAYVYKSKRYTYLAVFSAMITFYSNYQRSYTGNDSYIETFQNLIQVVYHCKGNLGNHPTLIKATRPDNLRMYIM